MADSAMAAAFEAALEAAASRLKWHVGERR